MSRRAGSGAGVPGEAGQAHRGGVQGGLARHDGEVGAGGQPARPAEEDKDRPGLHVPGLSGRAAPRLVAAPSAEACAASRCLSCCAVRR
jgi:hypothetical protein